MNQFFLFFFLFFNCDLFMYILTQTSTGVLKNNKQVQIKLYYYYNDHEDSWLQVSTFFLSNMVMKTENDTLLD